MEKLQDLFKKTIKKYKPLIFLGTAVLGITSTLCSKNGDVPVNNAYQHFVLNHRGIKKIEQNKDFDKDGKNDLYVQCEDGSYFIKYSGSPFDELFHKMGSISLVEKVSKDSCEQKKQEKK